MQPISAYTSLAVRVGVDIGQKMDPTAVVVVEVQERGDEEQNLTSRSSPAELDLRGAGSSTGPFPHSGIYDPRRRGEAEGEGVHYVARLVGRLALGTGYPAVARRLAEMEGRLRARGYWPDFWVDATGVGQPVVDLLRQSYGLAVTPVYLTGSDQVTRGENGEIRMGKAPLVSRLQVLLQSERIHLPQTAEAAVLCQELLDYEIRVNEHANAQFGAFRLGKHDDLATALGLACWEENWGTGVSYVIPPVDVEGEDEEGYGRRSPYPW